MFTERENARLSEVEKEIMENLDFYVKTALTIEQQARMNKAERAYYQSNKLNEQAGEFLAYA